MARSATPKRPAKKPVATKPAAKKRGRPSIYSDELAERICDMVADGMSLRAVCEREDMPDRATVRNWLRSRDEFFAQFVRAREEQADTLADSILAIADEASADQYMDDQGRLRTDNEVVQRSRLRVEARLKLMEKLAPKKYGARLELSGQVDMPLDQVQAKIAMLVGKAKGEGEGEGEDGPA